MKQPSPILPSLPACITLLVSVVVLLAWVAPVTADGPVSTWSVPLAGSNQATAMAVMPSGEVTIAWLRMEADQSGPLIHVANVPEGMTFAIGQLPPSVEIDQLELALGSHANPRLAWLAPLTDTVSIGTLPLASDDQRLIYHAPNAEASTLALSPEQHPFYGWTAHDHISILDLDQGITHTIASHSETSPQQMSLQVDSNSVGHLVWQTREPGSGTSSIHYANTVSGTESITVTISGTMPHLALDGANHPHLLWREGDQLLYANDQSWTTPALVAQGNEIGATDIAVSPQGQAEAVWSTPNGIWHAHSLHWQLTRQHLVQAEDVQTLTCGLDGQGAVHIAWTQAGSAAEATLHYFVDQNRPAQVQVSYPLEGMRLTSGQSLHAVTNPPSEGWRQLVFYLAPTDQRNALPDAWRWVGSDRNGSDGWSVSLGPDILPGRYRAIALAITQQGETFVAEGETFVLDSDLGGQTVVTPSMSQPLSGQTTLDVLWLPDQSKQRPAKVAVDLFLEPEQCAPLGNACLSSDQQPSGLYYLGRHELVTNQKPRASSLDIDTRQIPDGSYRVAHRDVTSGIWWPVANVSLQIDNSMPPSIRVLTPEGNEPVRDTLQAEVEADDPNGLVTQVDFYLERDFALFETSTELVSAPDRIWVGSDDTHEDGWHLDVPVNSAWLGKTWRLMAVARDRDDLAQTAYGHEPVQILAPDTPQVRILRPNGERPLHGQERIVLSSGPGPATIEVVDAFLQTPDGALQALGAMQAQWPSWQLDWDTTTVADGTYRLQCVVSVEDKSQALRQESAWFQINNQSVRYAFAAPKQGQTLQGAQILRLRETGALSELSRVSFFWRDAYGSLHTIGQDTSHDNDWGILWQTASVLDGRYQIVAQVEDQEGRQSFVERDVVLQNHTPLITLQSDTATAWSGEQTIVWQASHPIGRPMTVSVSYSPDAGLHWLVLADGLASDQTFVWDSRSVPDSSQARLRLTVNDGERWSQSVHTLVIDNQNSVPQVALLSPLANSDYSLGEIIVAWQVVDAEDDLAGIPLEIGLDYRVEGSGWRRIRYDLGPRGAFEWDDAWLEPGATYDLRITARDASGAQGSHTIEGIRLIDNHAPRIRLLWPNAPVELASEAIILWQAQDEDGDPLSVALYYSDNGGQAWLPLAEELDNTGYFGWQLSFLPPSNQYRLRAIVSDGKSTGISESQSTFVVGRQQQQMVNLLAPVTGRPLAGLELMRWSTLNSGDQGLAEIELRQSENEPWRSLAELPNQGFYIWDTQALPDGPYDVRVTVSDTICCASSLSAEPLLIDNGTNRAPQITLLSPQRREHWNGLHEIRWDAHDADGDPITATLSFSLDQGRAWQRIGVTDGRLGNYLWDTRAITESVDIVLAVAISDGHTTTRVVSPGTITLLNQPSLPPQVSLISPSTNGGLLRGDTLAWRAYDADFDPLGIALWQSQTAGHTWVPVAQHLANTGQYVLDQALLPDQDTLFKIMASDGVWTSEYTSLATQPRLPDSMRAEIAVLAPAPGAHLSGNQEIAWQVTVPAGAVWQIGLDVSADGGTTWVPLTQTLELQGAMVWDTTLAPNGIYQLRVMASNERSAQRLVTAPLFVDNQRWVPDTLSLLSPAGAEIWSGLQEIQWQAADAQGQPLPVDLAYSADRGATWIAIARNLRGTDHYTWDTTRAPNCQEVWLRVSFEREGFKREALSQAPVAIRNLIGPMVRLETPQVGAHWRSSQSIAWQAAGETGYPLRLVLEASLDGGKSWQELARNLPMQGNYRWDTRDLPSQSQALVRMRAADRGLTARDTIWQPITINDQRPAQLPPFYLP